MADKKKVAFGASAGIAAIVATMLSGIYHREGGYSDHAADRGGKTNLGVTEQVAKSNGYKGDMRAFPKQCDTEKDVCADRIYYETYIEKPGFIPLIKASPAVGDELFDTGVNMGTYYPRVWVQASLMEVCPSLEGKAPLKVDGNLGNKTVDYFTTCQTKLTKPVFCRKMLDALDNKQKGRYNSIVANNASQRVFYRGWMSHRINNVDRKRCDTEG